MTKSKRNKPTRNPAELKARKHSSGEDNENSVSIRDVPIPFDEKFAGEDDSISKREKEKVVKVDDKKTPPNTFWFDRSLMKQRSFTKDVKEKENLHKRQLASFYPIFLIDQLKKKSKITSSTFFLNGACMIADISGFVRLCGRLSAKGIDGLDDLSKCTNSFIGGLVDTVYKYGGDVVSFAGDAIICVFIAQENELGQMEGACCRRAMKCSMEIKEFESLDLNAHVAVSYGEICFAILGGHQKEWVYLINGECVNELGDALNLAGMKESVCTKSCYSKCTLFDDQFLKAVQLPGGSWKVLSVKDFKIEAVRKETINVDKINLHAFVPSCVRAAVLGGSFSFLSELREVTTMFLLLDSYSAKKNKDLLTLQSFFHETQKILKQTGGFMRQFLVDDKGCVLIAMWGVPKSSYVNNASRAVRASILISNLCITSGQACSIGVTTGNAYCGTVGSVIRQDYVAMGDPVNMAARLMGKAKGRILVDEETVTLLPKSIAESLTLAESMLLKGKTKPIQPYYFADDYLASLAAFDHDRVDKGIILDANITTAMTRELNLLSEYQVSLENKQVVLKENSMPDARIIQVEGSPGTGKSECAKRFIMLAKDRDIRTISVKCLKNEQSVGYSIYRKIIVELMGPVHFSTEARQTEAIMQMLQYAFPQMDLEEAAMKHFNILKVALNLKWNFSTEKFTFPTFARIRAFTFFGSSALSQILSSLLQICCTAIVIEDAHFCDDLSWKEISHSLNGLSSPLVVLITYRSEAEANMSIRRTTHGGADTPKTLNSISHDNFSDMNDNGASRDKKKLYTDKTANLYSASPGIMAEKKRNFFGAKISPLESMPVPSFPFRKLTNRINFFKNKPTCVTLVIPLLKYHDVHYILCTALNEEAPQFVTEIVLEVSGGNHYWVKSISKFIKESGFEQFSSHIGDDHDTKSTFKSTSKSTVSPPPKTTETQNVEVMRKKLERHVVCHLEMFPSKIQTIAKYAAVIGEEFNVEILKSILPETIIGDDGGQDLSACLQTLSEEGIIFLISSKPPVYAFHNEIIRNTLYSFVLPSEASLVHQDIAQTIEKMFKDDLTPYYATLTYHFAYSPEAMKSHAFAYSIRSADQEISQGAFHMGYIYLQFAVDFLEFLHEVDMIILLIETAISDMTNYHGPKDLNSFTEETLKSFKKMLTDLKFIKKSRKCGEVEIKHCDSSEKVVNDVFIQSLNCSSDGSLHYHDGSTSSLQHSNLDQSVLNELGDDKGKEKACCVIC